MHKSSVAARVIKRPSSIYQQSPAHRAIASKSQYSSSVAVATSNGSAHGTSRGNLPSTRRCSSIPIGATNRATRQRAASASVERDVIHRGSSQRPLHGNDVCRFPRQWTIHRGTANADTGGNTEYGSRAVIAASPLPKSLHQSPFERGPLASAFSAR